MYIITQADARAQGLKRFYTGVPCKKHGHVSERLTSSGECIGCKQYRESVKYAADSSHHRQYYTKNRERLLLQQKQYDDNRRSDKIEYGKRWRKQHSSYAEAYRQRRSDLFRFHAAMRRAKRKRATPTWVEADLIKLLYAEAERISRETGIPHEVDHIIPLQNELVCGLHCLDNLQILTEDANRAKKNSFSI